MHSTVDERTLAVALPLRIAQELTVNAVKHARPSRIDVRVTRDADRIVLEVNDDGVGIDSSDAGRAVQAGQSAWPWSAGAWRTPAAGSRSRREPTAGHTRASCCRSATPRKREQAPGLNLRGHSLDDPPMRPGAAPPTVDPVKEATLRQRWQPRPEGKAETWVGRASSVRMAPFETSAFGARSR